MWKNGKQSKLWKLHPEMSCSDYFDNFIFTMIEFAIDLQTNVLQCNKRMCYEMRGCFYLFCSFCLLCTHYCVRIFVVFGGGERLGFLGRLRFLARVDTLNVVSWWCVMRVAYRWCLWVLTTWYHTLTSTHQVQRLFVYLYLPTLPYGYPFRSW